MCEVVNHVIVKGGSLVAEYIRKVLSLHDCVGLALGLACPGQPDQFHLFGCQDTEQRLPVNKGTRFGAASLTKSMTAVAIMQLQEKGLLSVHDPVARYVSEFRIPDPEATKQVTLHHLLTHTAGLPPLPTLGKVLAGELQTVPDMLSYLADLAYELLGPPGVVFSYSNESTALLGAVVERVSGLPYREYIGARLFEPAAMAGSGFDSVSGPLTPARGLCTTIMDALRYTELFRTGGCVGGVRLLSEESVRAMTHPWVREPDGAHYGYCLMLTPEYPGGMLVEHVGSTRGISAYFSVVPEQGVAAVVLANTGGVPAGRIALRAVNQILGLPAETDRLPFTGERPAVNLADFPGEYGGTDGFPLKVYLAAGGAHLELDGGTPLLPVAGDRFLYQQGETEMSATFLRDAGGSVSALFFGLRLLRRTA